MNGGKRTWGVKGWRKCVNRVALRQEDKDVVLGTRPRIRGKAKDTRRWCQGHVGKAHQWGAWEPMGTGFYISQYRQRCCAVCGKKDWPTMHVVGQNGAESPLHAEVSQSRSPDSFL